jgi:hypothetical protein
MLASPQGEMELPESFCFPQVAKALGIPIGVHKRLKIAIIANTYVFIVVSFYLEG